MNTINKPIIILLVEDDDDHAELIKRSLENSREYSILMRVNDGEKALDYVYGKGEYTERKMYPFPNLILLDLRIPKVDGLTVLAKIKSDPEYKHIPIIVLTSSENESDMRSAYSNYANSYLVKPLDYNKYVNLMEEIRNYWLKYNNNIIK